jgi:viologen exporter family transport system ATP-binding protein
VAIVSLDDVVKTFVVRKRAGRLRRTRSEVRAVDHVSFSVEAGSTLGFVGPNGAGKSTTIKMLVGILVPTGGVLRVDGRDPSRQRVELARRIGVVFGQRTQLWWDLPLGDSFDLLRHVYRVPVADHRHRRDELVELLEMGDFVATPVRQLSLGQRMRGELAAALLHDPPILFLDEPTIGLDVVSKEAVRGFLAHLNRERGTTLLLTTHDLVDVERLCDRLLIIDHGRVIEDSTVDGVKARYGVERTLVVDLEVPGPPLDVDGATVTRVQGPRQWLRFRRDRHTAASLLAQVSAQAPVRDIAVEEPAIEDVVRHIYTLGDRSLPDEPAAPSPAPAPGSAGGHWSQTSAPLEP